ncbi:MAG: 5-deoxy-glucuronate isomerase [Thermaceae bacterium]|nr:5-deoxy-glucuronate isomerase [Thermaceae bacterium]
MNSPNQIKPVDGQLEVTPTKAGWRYLSFKTIRLKAGENLAGNTQGQEAALVPLAGTLEVKANRQTIQLSRKDVFSELPNVLYLPPGSEYVVEAISSAHFALGSAPAEGKYPLRLFRPPEMRVEMRGGANATRQVNHILGPDLPAERLLLYEVYTPSGFWSGWPPHRHDGRRNSLYIEETYYYRITPQTGWAVHRNYSPEDSLDELLLVRDGDLVLAPKGYHPVAAAPGSNVYYLNFMAGEALNEARATSPVDDPDWGWMRGDWVGQPLELPIGGRR